MNKVYAILSLLLLTSCATVRPQTQETKNQDTIAKEEKKVDKTLDQIGKNEQGKKSQTSTLAQGIQHSLNQVTNPPIQVETAKSLNERVVSIVGSPNIDEMKRIKATVDLLNSAVEEERKKGQELLNKRDEIIIKLQQENAELNQKYDDQMWELTDKAKEQAKIADANKATLDAMSGMFGLNAVWWGLKKFFFNFLTFIIVFGIIFLVLRILSTLNPVAAAAFGIFNLIGTTLLSMIKTLTPNAFEMLNFTTNDKVNEYKSPLTKIVDVIQELREKQKDAPDMSVTLDQILKKFDKEMDTDEKHLIDKILSELRWRR
jgi:hypothetical protein